MRVFSAANLDNMRRKRYESFGEFFRALITEAPEYGVKPAINHIHNIVNGRVTPGTPYLSLFAHVLECKVDDFFEAKREKG